MLPYFCDRLNRVLIKVFFILGKVPDRYLVSRSGPGHHHLVFYGPTDIRKVFTSCVTSNSNTILHFILLSTLRDFMIVFHHSFLCHYSGNHRIHPCAAFIHLENLLYSKCIFAFHSSYNLIQYNTSQST